MATILKSSQCIIAKAARAANHTNRTFSAHAQPSQQFASHTSGRPFTVTTLSKAQGKRCLMSTAAFASSATAESAFDFTVTDIDDKKVDLSQYKGKVVLVVNVASQCGFTPQYKELGELYNKYTGQGLVILGFPCNQFGGQEPAENSKIKKFAQDRGAAFPMMAKVDVNGAKAEPFYSYLKSKQGGILVSDIKWNFTKFLIDREGRVVKRYGSATNPLSIENDIKALL